MAGFERAHKSESCRRAAEFSVIVFSVLALVACSQSKVLEAETSIQTKVSFESNKFRGDLLTAATDFETEFIRFYLAIGDLTEDLLSDFLKHADDANKGYLAALKRIRALDDSTKQFFDSGVELKHLTSDEIDPELSDNDKVLLTKIEPLVIQAMNLVSQFLQVARDAATALSVVDRPTWVTLQDELVEIAQNYYATGTSRGQMYQSLGERLDSQGLRDGFRILGEAF